MLRWRKSVQLFPGGQTAHPFKHWASLTLAAELRWLDKNWWIQNSTVTARCRSHYKSFSYTFLTRINFLSHKPTLAGCIFAARSGHLCRLQLRSKVNQAIEVFFESWSRDQGDLWTAETKNTLLQFDLWPKWSRASEGTDQAHFLPVNTLDPSHKQFNRWLISDCQLLHVAIEIFD